MSCNKSVKDTEKHRNTESGVLSMGNKTEIAQSYPH